MAGKKDNDKQNLALCRSIKYPCLHTGGIFYNNPPDPSGNSNKPHSFFGLQEFPASALPPPPQEFLIPDVGQVQMVVVTTHYDLNSLFTSQRLLTRRLTMSFVGVCSFLTYIKYYVGDYDTAVFHLGFIASGFTIAVYGSPLVTVVRIDLYFHVSLKRYSVF